MNNAAKVVRTIAGFSMSWAASGSLGIKTVHIALVQKEKGGTYGVFFVQEWQDGTLMSEQDYRQETAAIAAWAAEMPRTLAVERARDIARLYEKAST